MTTISLPKSPGIAEQYLLRRSYRVRVLTILLLANTLSFADRAILSAVVEPLRQDLGFSDVQIGMLQGLAFAVMYSLVGIPIGYLSERRNRIGILVACIMVFSVATGLCGVASGLSQLFLLRVMVGIGEGGYMSPATSLVADHYRSDRRASALSVILLGVPVGFFVGSLLAGVVAEHWGWRAVFYVMSVPGVIVSLLMALLLREPPRGLADGFVDREAAPSFYRVMRDLFSQSAFRRLIVAGVVCTCALNFIGPFQMVYFLRVHKLTLSQAGLLQGIVSLVSLGSGMLIGGALTDRFAQRDRRWYLWFPALGCSAGAVCYAVGFAQTAIVPAVGLIVVGGILVFFYSAPSYAVAQEIAGVRMRASAVALFGTLIGLLGTGLGPLFAGAISDYIARSTFSLGEFDAMCKGGHSASGDPSIGAACQAAAAMGIKGALMSASVLLLIAALYYFLTAVAIGRDSKPPARID